MKKKLKIDFSGKTVIITGATHGIGKKIAADFYDLGANLLLTGTGRMQIQAENRSVKDKGRVKYFSLDFLDEESIERFLSDIKSYGRIDVCVNNAGINRISYIYNTPINDWDDILKVNLRGPFILMKEIGNIMRKNLYGRIVNIASIFGVITKEKRSSYTASKAGLIGLTKTAAVDMARYNILVNSVSPGFIEAGMTKKILSKKEISDLRSSVPMERLGNFEDVSNVVLFLASDLNTYITGQNIVVDGGYVSI